MNHRDRQIICGLFLSKFDREGLAYLGFEGFAEAYNALGYALRSRPNSIKNYRDEFDPYFPNKREGWHKREFREHCKHLFEAHKNADITQLGNLIKDFLPRTKNFTSMPDVERVLSIHDADNTTSFAKRLITGQSAEQYFALNSKSMNEFAGMTVTDTTAWGCGFDFKLSCEDSAAYLAIEVKGLRSKSGPIQLTKLEHDMAAALTNKYYLVVVRNFLEKPCHTVIKNPLNSPLSFSRIEQKETRITWRANITA